MNTSHRIIVLASVGAFLCVVAGWFVYTYDVTREFKTRWSEKAYLNSFLALEQLAQKRGAKVDIKRRYALPESTSGTLVLLGGRLALTAREEEDLMAWVERGGHLVAVPIEPPKSARADAPVIVDDDDTESTGRDPLLARLGVSYLNPRGTGGGTRRDIDWVDLELPEGKIRANRYVFASKSLVADADTDVTWRVRSGGQDVALRIPYGEGRVTLFPGLSYATNWSITRYDHAALAVTSLDLVPGADVTVVRSYTSAGFFRWLWDNAKAAILALAALVVAWGWRHMPRLGPTVPAPVPARQSLAEHIRATGRWLWRSGAHQALYAASRSAFEKRLAVRIPGSSALPTNEQAKLLSQRTGIDLETAELVLDGSTPPDGGQFVARIRLIESILKKL